MEKQKSQWCFFHKTSSDESVDLLLTPQWATPQLDMSYIGIQSLFLPFVWATFDAD